MTDNYLIETLESLVEDNVWKGWAIKQAIEIIRGLDEDLPYQCDACVTSGYAPDAKCECTPAPQPLPYQPAERDDRRAEVEAVAWERTGFAMNFVRGSQRPPNNTSNPNEWSPLYSKATIDTLQMRIEEMAETILNCWQGNYQLGAAAIDTLTAERDRLKARVEEDRQDAERFRALTRGGHIKMQGSSGVDPQTGERNGSNVHFGAEFWPEPIPVGFEQHYEASTRWGHFCITALADAILEDEAARQALKGEHA